MIPKIPPNTPVTNTLSAQQVLGTWADMYPTLDEYGFRGMQFMDMIEALAAHVKALEVRLDQETEAEILRMQEEEDAALAEQAQAEVKLHLDKRCPECGLPLGGPHQNGLYVCAEHGPINWEAAQSEADRRGGEYEFQDVPDA